MLFAGGKDSTYAVQMAMKNNQVRYLLTMASKNPHSWMFHTPNVHMTGYQAEAMGIEQIVRPTSGEKDKELDDLRDAIAGVKAGIDGVVSGAIASSYQKSRIDKICAELGLKSIAPLWGKNQAELVREMINSGLKAIITSVAAQGFNEGWLGREIDENTLGDLVELNRKYGINPAGEGGEYESFVLEAPFFKKRVELLEVERIWRKTDGYLLIKRARTVEK